MSTQTSPQSINAKGFYLSCEWTTLETSSETALAHATATEAPGLSGAVRCALLLHADLTHDEDAAEIEPPSTLPDSAAALAHGFFGRVEARRLTPSWAALRRLSSITMKSRFADFVTKGKVAEGEQYLRSLPAQDDATDVSLLAELARLLEKRNCGVEVLCGSLTVKVHDLLPEDRPEDLAQRLEHSNLDCDAFLSFCRVEAWKAGATGSAGRFNSLFTVLPARDDVHLANYPAIPLPSLNDEVFLAVLESKPKFPTSALRTTAFTKSMAATIHFHRTELWQIPASFLFVFVDGSHPLDLRRAFSVTATNEDEADSWAALASAHLQPQLTQLFHCDGENFVLRHAAHGDPVFLLLAWDRQLYEHSLSLVQQLLASLWSVAPSKPSLTARVPALNEPSRAVAETFSFSVARRLLASVVPNQGLTDSWSLRQVVQQYLACGVQELPAGSEGHANEMLLRRLEVKSQRLLQQARQLDAWASGGLSILQVLRWQFQHSLRKVPLLGDAIAQRREGGVIEVMAAGRQVLVQTVGHQDLVRCFRSDQPLLAQFAANVEAILGPPPYGVVRLYHGTTIEAATDIAQNGVEPQLFTPNADFGAVFYTTRSFAYAVEAAYRRFSGGLLPSAAAAVLVYEIGEDQLRPWEAQVQQLAEGGQYWQRTVRAFRHSALRQLEQTARARLMQARVLHGPICRNAGDVDGGRPAQPHAQLTQHAFRYDGATSVLDEDGRLVRVLRITGLRSGDWDGRL